MLVETLFNILENGIIPMSMVKEVVPLVKWLRANDDYIKYAVGIDEFLESSHPLAIGEHTN